MPTSQTRKRSSRLPKSLNDLQWLANPYEQLRRSRSFSGTIISDEDFYRFFENVGEVARYPSPRNVTRSNKKSPKSAGKSPKAAGKSPKAAGKSPKAAGKSPT